MIDWRHSPTYPIQIQPQDKKNYLKIKKKFTKLKLLCCADLYDVLFANVHVCMFLSSLFFKIIVTFLSNLLCI